MPSEVRNDIACRRADMATGALMGVGTGAAIGAVAAIAHLFLAGASFSIAKNMLKNADGLKRFWVRIPVKVVGGSVAFGGAANLAMAGLAPFLGIGIGGRIGAKFGRACHGDLSGKEKA